MNESSCERRQLLQLVDPLDGALVEEIAAEAVVRVRREGEQASGRQHRHRPLDHAGLRVQRIDLDDGGDRHGAAFLAAFCARARGPGRPTFPAVAYGAHALSANKRARPGSPDGRLAAASPPFRLLVR